MASNFFIKKSSIPRAMHEDQVKPRLRGPKPPLTKPTNHTHHILSKPGPNDGLLKEDGDAVRRSLLELEADHARMKQTLDQTVQDAEERLATMEKLMAERERLCSANLTAAAERTGTLEQQVENYEKTLMENNIDPETGAPEEPTGEQVATVEKVKKVTKGDVSKMREKLHQMDENSDKYLIEVQNMLQEIEELEATSSRVCDTSPLDGLAPKDLTALIQRVEQTQRKEERQRKKQERTETGEEDGDDTEEEEEEQDSPSSEEKEKEDPPMKPKVFITQKNERIN
ncbi:hypothetical protein ACOMHN_031542 [Nucella lapillus]